MAKNFRFIVPTACLIGTLISACTARTEPVTIPAIPSRSLPEPAASRPVEPPSSTPALEVPPTLPLATPATPQTADPVVAKESTAQTSEIIEKVPLTSATLPPYPYFDYPAADPDAYYRGSESEFDRFGVIVGDKVHFIEGRYKEIRFSNEVAKLSVLAAHRSYTTAIENLGAVKVNTVTPENAAFLAAFDSPKLRKELHIPEREMSYDAYALRTDEGISWIVLMVSESRTNIFVAQAKELVSPVIMKRAAAIKSELDAKGHIALYINFDTDKAVVKADGKAAVDEISSVLKSDPALRLSIEGHTDNVGDAGHNSTLSKQRAEAVLQSLLASGIDKARLASAGHGADKPLVPNTDEANRAKNRRVELVKVVKT